MLNKKFVPLSALRPFAAEMESVALLPLLQPLERERYRGRHSSDHPQMIERLLLCLGCWGIASPDQAGETRIRGHLAPCVGALGGY